MNPFVSLTASAHDTEPKDARAVALIEDVRSGRWREPVEYVRAKFAEVLAATGDPQQAKEAVKELKEQLPGILWSGKFERRCNDGLIAHSGLISADLDNLGDRMPQVREKLLASPHLYALLQSPTGTGLKAVFRVPADAALHARSFAAVQAHVREICGEEIDPACKDLARLCFVSFDPEAFLNRDAVELPPLAAPAKPSRTKIIAPTVATTSTLPPSVDRLLVTGAHAGERNVQAFNLACQLRDAGLPEAEAETRMHEFAARCNPPLDEREALTCLLSAYATPPREPARNTERLRLKTGTATGDYLEPAECSDAQSFERLAALQPAEYDRCRKAEAAKLNILVGTLDVEVAKRRAPVTGTVQGSAMDFATAEPWPQPVNGTEVLDDVANTFTRFIALPPHAADTLALWTAHAHAFEAFIHSPRLNLYSPEKGCGKTLVLDVVAALVPRPLRTESITPAVLFRLVELHKPVLLLDEIDTYLHEADELRGLLNAGHKRGARAYRCEGERNEVRGFSAFSPAVLAGIGSLPGTLHDRSIVVRLTRAKPGEVAARFDSRRTLWESELCRKLARWTTDNLPQLETIDPALPDSAFNRLADNWRPLFAIAETAGGDWPARAVAAFMALTTGDDLDAHGIGTALLADIRGIYITRQVDRLTSARIAEVLGAMDGKPWPEFGKGGKPISTNQLAKLLRRFDVTPRTIKLADGSTAKGYHREMFDDAFARYLPDLLLSSRNPVTMPENIDDSSLFKTSPEQNQLRFENTVPAHKDADGDGVTVQIGGVADPFKWPDGSPITEPPEDLPLVDPDGQRVTPETEEVEL